MAVTGARNRNDRPPLDAETLAQAALAYAARYATTRARLRAYLVRKVRDRGWGGDADADFDGLVEQMTGLGYVDDRAFASARAATLGRRGYGQHRVDAALRAAGIGEEDGAEARGQARERAWQAALRYAERRKIGPYAASEGNKLEREKALAAMLRAGHPGTIARRIIRSPPGEIPDADNL